MSDRRRIAPILASILAVPALARAHADDLGQPREVLERTFTLDLAVVLPALSLAALFVIGAARLHARHPALALGGRSARFLGALVIVVAAVCTPLDALGTALFSAHMAQHLVLVLIAAPLAASAMPSAVLLWGLPRGARTWLASHRSIEHTARAIARPGIAFVLHALALVAWHLPALYEAALRDDVVHALEHGTMVGTAFLYWGAIVRAGATGGMGHGVAVLYAFAGGVLGTVLGALMTAASSPWYAAHAGGPAQFGLTRLEDQQLAGLLMWVPGGAVYGVAALLCFGAWLRASELHTARAEAR